MVYKKHKNNLSFLERKQIYKNLEKVDFFKI